MQLRRFSRFERVLLSKRKGKEYKEVWAAIQAEDETWGSTSSQENTSLKVTTDLLWPWPHLVGEAVNVTGPLNSYTEYVCHHLEIKRKSS